MKNIRKSIVSFLFMTVLCTVTALAMPLCAQAANKALKAPGAVFRDKTTRNADRGVQFLIKNKKTDKLKKSGMSISAKVYVPAKALKKKGDEIWILGSMTLNEGEEYLGFVDSKYYLTLRRTGKKKVKLFKVSYSSNKESKVGKYASVKKKGSYYIVTVKKLPLADFFDSEDNPAPIDTEKTFTLESSVTVISVTKKGWSGNVYVDDVKLKSAKKTQTVTFNKKDYLGIKVNNWANGGEMKYKLKKAMK